MANLLKLYKYIDGGVNDTPFPNEDEQVVVSSYRYDVKRMGGAPTIPHALLCIQLVWIKNGMTQCTRCLMEKSILSNKHQVALV